jgi:hypothetical protein
MMTSPTAPNRWLSDLTDADISRFTPRSSKLALRAYFIKFQDLPQIFIDSQAAYDEVFGHFDEQIRIVMKTRDVAGAQKAMRHMRDCYIAHVDRMMIPDSRRVLERALWKEEDKGVIDRALAVDAKATEEWVEEAMKYLFEGCMKG